MKTISRRTVLRGSGVTLSLPFLEIMSSKVQAQPSPAVPRLAVFYFPMGCYQKEWTATAGADQKPNIPAFLQSSLGPIRDRLVWLNNLSNPTSGKGAHETAAGTFLNCADMTLPGPTLKKSADQLIADHLSSLPGAAPTLSLTLSAPGFLQAASCCRDVEVGLNYISWRGGNTPTTKLQDPRDVFERLFATGSTTADRQKLEEARQRKLSALDLAKTQSDRLKKVLGSTDRQRLEQHFEAVRSVERRLNAAVVSSCTPPTKPNAGLSFEDQNQLMYDLTALAFECDLTKVVTFIMDFEFSDRLIRSPGITSGHHSVSHHGENAGKISQYRLIQNFYAKRYADFVNRLASKPAGPGKTVLDESCVILASGMNNGDDHARTALPFIMSGTAHGRIAPGRVLDVQQPVATVFRSLLRLYNIPDAGVSSFGKGMGELRNLIS